jgi:hypothetical protein
MRWTSGVRSPSFGPSRADHDGLLVPGLVADRVEFQASRRVPFTRRLASPTDELGWAMGAVAFRDRPGLGVTAFRVRSRIPRPAKTEQLRLRGRDRSSGCRQAAFEHRGQLGPRGLCAGRCSFRWPAAVGVGPDTRDLQDRLPRFSQRALPGPRGAVPGRGAPERPITRGPHGLSARANAHSVGAAALAGRGSGGVPCHRIGGGTNAFVSNR